MRPQTARIIMLCVMRWRSGLIAISVVTVSMPMLLLLKELHVRQRPIPRDPPARVGSCLLATLAFQWAGNRCGYGHTTERSEWAAFLLGPNAYGCTTPLFLLLSRRKTMSHVSHLWANL
jgi:hypothetical protein